jgi:hypothetical protein
MSRFEVQELVALIQFQVLSESPFTVIPAPLANVSDGESVLASSMFLSSTVTVVEFTVVVVPFTIRLPWIVVPEDVAVI